MKTLKQCVRLTLILDFMQCSAVSIVNFEQANTEWIYFNVGKH